MGKSFDAIIIGSGFGGAITGCRLAKKWPGGRVLILERGRRYPMGTFARTPHDIANAFWGLAEEKTPRPKVFRKARGGDGHGIFDVRNYKHMDVLIGAGLGGGSLIYANVFMIPPEEVFDERWPRSCKRSMLAHYYAIAKEVLGSRPIPTNTGDPRREIIRTKLFEEVAKQNGRVSQLTDINVFFGNDFAHPTPMGQQEKNRYGATQTSCVYCAECDLGCNYHAKNTLDWRRKWTSGKSIGSIGWVFHDLLIGDPSYRTCVLLCMGIDKSNGVMALDQNQQLMIDWPYCKSISLYRAILEEGKRFAGALGASDFCALPNWDWPIRNNITVHVLGVCVLADDDKHGVTSADRKTFGQVFGYEGLFVADGAIIPTAVGANPTATISALSEMVAEGITGMPPDANL
jgi:hypothetical protein